MVQSMNTPVRILILEHDPNDLELLQYELKKGSLLYIYSVVQTREEFEKALNRFKPEIILSDYSLPTFDGATAFRIKEEMAPDIPFIIVSGTIGEENAVELIKTGVTDYILKDKLFTVHTKISRALREAKEYREKITAEEQLKEYSDQITDILESIGDGFFTLDHNWIVTYWNKEAENQSGKKREDTVGKNIWEVYPDAIQQKFYSEYNKAVEQRITVHFEEYLSSIDGWLEVSAYPSPQGLSVYFKNVTEKRMQKKQLENYAHELERSNKELEQFAYIASHDLQEPLRMVGSFLQLLQKKYASKLDEQASQYIYYAVDGATRMKDLINDLLNYSRINTDISMREVNLSAIINEVLANLNTGIRESGAMVHFEGMPVLQADPVQMLQLFQNLISNSIKYRKDGITPVIKVQARKKDTHWLFAVNDNGIGIEKKYSDRIFVIFKQLHDKSKYKGTGIGLAIAKRIVERHGGKIWFESEPGKGSTFYFTIKSDNL
jgi:PAS domain S-box-containing protein